MVQKVLRLDCGCRHHPVRKLTCDCLTVLKVTGLSKPTVYRLCAAGRFPKPFKLDQRASGWLEDEVAQWQAARIAKRDSAPAPKGRRAA